MTKKKSETIIKIELIKLSIWSIVTLSVIMGGCAVSEKKSPSDTIDVNSERNIEADSHDEFDLFEEEFEKQAVKVFDPLEPLNRMMYHLNDALYFWVLKPCTQGFKAVVPKPSRISLRNFFHNLATPVRYVNCLLQGKGDSADIELRRFIVNTTVGILGFGDPALEKWELEPIEEDLGQSLATHGFGDGFYIFWPLFGPSTLRDSVGTVGDLFLSPIHYVKPVETSMAISAGKMINKTSFHLGKYENLKSDSLDPYVAIREIYIQYRSRQIKE